MYSVLFNLRRVELVDMINTFRDEMVCSPPSGWASTFREITAGADLRICLSGECCSGGSIPLLRGPQNFVRWLVDRKDYENMITHFNLFTIACVISDKEISTPAWVGELVERMGNVRDVTTMPLLAAREEVGLFAFLCLSPAHTDGLSRVLPPSLCGHDGGQEAAEPKEVHTRWVHPPWQEVSDEATGRSKGCSESGTRTPCMPCCARG